MMWVEGIATVTMVLSVLCFVLYVIALLRMPPDAGPRSRPWIASDVPCRPSRTRTITTPRRSTTASGAVSRRV